MEASSHNIDRADVLVGYSDISGHTLATSSSAVKTLFKSLLTPILTVCFKRPSPDYYGDESSLIFGTAQLQALVVSMKEIYGWLLISAIIFLTIILLSYSSLHPFTIFPKWSSIRRAIRHFMRTSTLESEMMEKC